MKANQRRAENKNSKSASPKQAEATEAVAAISHAIEARRIAHAEGQQFLHDNVPFYRHMERFTVRQLLEYANVLERWAVLARRQASFLDPMARQHGEVAANVEWLN